MEVLLACLLLLARDIGFAANDSVHNRSDSPAWSATSAQYASQVWQSEDGLPSSRVQSLAQTPDGYLWVGTHDGLARFDGMQFTIYNVNNTSALTRNFITALCAGRDGSLYAGTENGLVIGKDGVFSRLDANNGLVGNVVTAICQTKQGAIWIGTTTGLSHYENRAFTNYTTVNGLRVNTIRFLFEDREGALWIATPQGLNCFRNGTMEQFTTNNGLPQMSVRSLCQDTNGELWISFDRGLAKYDGQRFVAYDLPDNLSRNYVSALCADSSGNLWVGAYGGLNRFYQEQFHMEVNNAGIPFDQINALLEDREGNIWAGSREGLVRLKRQRIFVFDVTRGLSLNNVMSVLQDRDGSLWLGTWGGGLDQLSGGRVRVYATTNSAMDDLVLALSQGADGSLWVGLDFDGGIRQIKDGRISSFTWKQGLPRVAVKVLHEDRTGRLWIGTAGGLYSMTARKIVNHGVKYNVLSSIIYAIGEDAQGAIWVGTDKGLGRWADGDFTTFSSERNAPQGPVDALLADEEGNLWIGTPRQGIFRYRAGKFFAYSQKEGLPGNEIFELLDDGSGSLWLSTDDGIFRVLKKDFDALDQNPQRPLVAIAYRRSDGLQSTVGGNVAKPSAWKARDGRLLFTTTKGLAVIDPKFAEINRTAPPVYIEEVKADSKPVWPVPGVAPAGFPPRFPPGRGEMEFSFAALSFANPDKCRFRYQLEGVDSDWSAPDAKRTAKYNNLYPGHYRFRVMACNGDGVWNETGASLAFYLRPHFWQTWLFQGLAVTVLVGVVGTIARFIFVQKMRQKLALLEMQHSLEKERTRISRDIHDDLGATLTQITLLSELAQRKANDPPKVNLYTAQISQTARDLVQAMDEIVWAVNPRNDSLPMVTGYIFQHAEKFFAGTPMRCRFDSPEEWPDQSLTAEARHHLFLTAKEALNNAARHSGATEIWVRWKLVDGELQLCIEDNGKGFAMTQGEQFGNGLSNMKKRMEEIGGAFELTSIAGGGTTVRLKLRLKR